MIRKIGYARVSRLEQDLALQLDALEQHGCETIYTDKVTGARASRPGLDECLESLREGDVLVVWRIDRLGRSVAHLVGLVEELRLRGIGFCSLNDGAIDTTTASGEFMFTIFSALAQFERRLIQERTMAGLSAARARGRKGGRPIIDPSDTRIQQAKILHANKSISIQQICDTLNITRTTLYRWIKM